MEKRSEKEKEDFELEEEEEDEVVTVEPQKLKTLSDLIKRIVQKKGNIEETSLDISGLLQFCKEPDNKNTGKVWDLIWELTDDRKVRFPRS